MDRLFPKVTAKRGGIDYTDRRTDAEKAASEAIQALIHRKVGDIRKAQIAAINVAIIDAMILFEHDVHIQYHPWKATRFVGISVEPRTTGLMTVMVHEHRDDYHWEED